MDLTKPLTRILLVDDEKDILQGLKRIINRKLPGVEIFTASQWQQALGIQRQEAIDIAILDVLMPEVQGPELMDMMLKNDPNLSVIMITAYGTIEMAVDAMRRGAWDFIAKPFEPDNLIRLINKTIEHNKLVRENYNLRQQVGEKVIFQNFVGESLPMQRFFELIKTTARIDYNVLVRGKSGTGKELTAKAIHSLSKRRSQPFITVNCPAIPKELLESELFGHQKGAFTGANKCHTGMFLEANHGVICLDEIGDIPIELQSKLLRVLQDQEIRPLGGTKTIKIDVRVIACTNRNLEKMMSKGEFREDLFYRLNVINLYTPSLAEISKDIPLLADHFAKKVCRELNCKPKVLSVETINALRRHAWPGNVRELENTIKRAVIFSPSEEICPEHLDLSGKTNTLRPYPFSTSTPYKDAKEQVIESFSISYIKSILSKTNGNVSEAARLSGLTRTAFQKIMRRYNIER